MLLNEEDNLDKIERKVEEAISSLRRGFSVNGGDIHFVKYSNGTVQIQLMGSFVGYPSDKKDLLLMIERQIRMLVPEVDVVEFL